MEAQRPPTMKVPALRVRADVVINRPPAVVFRFVAKDFFQNYRRWSPEVLELQCITDGPLGVGTTGRQVRVDMGRRTESTFRVTVFEVDRRLDFVGVSDPYRICYQFKKMDGCTGLRFDFEFNRPGIVFRFLEKPIQTALQKLGERVVRNIKRLLESETAGTR